jgi:hypothetical protein
METAIDAETEWSVADDVKTTWETCELNLEE